MNKRKNTLLGLLTAVLVGTAVFAGDIEMKINGATDAMTIDKADGSEAMRVTADGNVGIGTIAPSTGLHPETGQDLKLDVEGAVGASHYCDKDGENCSEAEKIVSVANNSGTKICSGITDVGQWEYYSYGPVHTGSTSMVCGAKITIDISSCNFSSPPIITTSVDGRSSHWLLVGTNSIYNRTANGFTVYSRTLGSIAPEACDASDIPGMVFNRVSYDWKIMWQATGN